MKTSLRLLSELHEICKEHPYRTDRDRSAKSAKSYEKYLKELHKEFSKQIDRYCNREKIENPKKKFIFDHQFIGCYWMLPYQAKEIETHGKYEYMDSHNDDLVMIDGYIQCIHTFLKANGVLTYLFMDIGYSKGQNDSYVRNPRRGINIIYYPTLKRWELDEYHLKQELHWTEASIEYYKKEIENHKKKGKDPHWYVERLEWEIKDKNEMKELLKIYDKN